jgi:hypothetical protein
MLTLIRRCGAKFSVMIVALALGVWTASGSSAFAHGGGGGGGHGGGGFGGGGFGGGHMGGFGGFGGGHFGGFGGFGGGFGRGGFGRGFGFNRFGGLGFGGFGGFFPWGLYGWGDPWGWGYGYPYGLGYGWGGYGLGYGLGGYGSPWYGYGYGYPGIGYGYGYGGYPGYGYGYGLAGINPYAAGNMTVAPANGFAYTSAYVPPATGATSNGGATQRRVLGIDEEPVVSTDGRRGIKVANVYPGSAAERAGLQVGDVVRSINGYMTEQRGNLAWIIANKTPNSELKMVVRTANDGKDHTITATLP